MAPADTKRAEIDFWWRGGDVLPQRELAEAIEEDLRSSRIFENHSDGDKSTLVLGLDEQVRRGLLRSRYSIELKAGDGRILSRHTGSCWNWALRSCARAIVDEAEAATHLLRAANR